jgi:TusE/DsrC/DsvC family sulfur relay protein
MPTATIAGHEVQINDEGFLTEYDEWTEDIGAELATNIGVEMTDRHWELIRWLREDYKEKGETATTRRVQTAGGFPTKEQFQLFPKKPAKKMAYVAGVPKPHGCV